ncbi:hypothetical protein SEA_APHELION_115 [Gordonia phage Aphelion]|uniref:Uncharacterized protein n=1 Tax=Gordonia phage Aphelion TaxID=2507860 RepID=A0A410TD92_9CAUD|nr:hypothetical protein SEA_APHELION_115 [Gordonia phage Aphelion]WNM66386.1 hypothetical protein SEA_CULVER_116 [Gordonia phage Culver]
MSDSPDPDAQARLERNPHAVEAIRQADRDLETGRGVPKADLAELQRTFVVMDAAKVILDSLNQMQDDNHAQIKRVFPDSNPKFVDYSVESWTAAAALGRAGMLKAAE